ncbi:hypothetical protein M404DRAFT_1004385 [Pisolithus tinctorius Marx 270]|uniref:Uncharacterized protein n=1 Tax=Pisolithus tinctorius Marx 270 TaxID=870435 RepID=A0A0C3NWV0_PISTI|nr:hypothetical protein M404DRAFT_1004385 [Pisolithus tinctorius Marx 270]
MVRRVGAGCCDPIGWRATICADLRGGLQMRLRTTGISSAPLAPEFATSDRRTYCSNKGSMQ